MRCAAVLARDTLPFDELSTGCAAFEASADFSDRFVEIDDKEKNGKKGGQDTPSDDASAAMIGENSTCDARNEHNDDDEPFGSYGFVHGSEPPQVRFRQEFAIIGENVKTILAMASWLAA